MEQKRAGDTDLIVAILQAATRYAERNALVIDNHAYTYEELFRMVRCIYEAICRQEESVVGIVAENKLETYASVLAVLIAGRTYVVLHPDYPDSRNRRIAEMAGLKLVLGSTPEGYPGMNEEEITLLCVMDLPIAELQDWEYQCSEETNAYVIFTSGSTGEPKGVPISRRNLNAFYRAYSRLGWKLDEHDRMLQMFELTFDVSVVSLLYPLTLGACIYPVGTREVKYLKVYDLLEKYDLTFAAVAPSLLQLLSPYFGEISLPHLKYLVVTAEASQAELLSRFRPCVPNASIVNLYGPTEGTIYCTSYLIPPLSCKQHNGMVAIGKPFEGVSVRIAGDEGHTLPAGQMGELWISGAQVMNGYWHDAEKTAGALVEWEDGKVYYKTGDLCFQDADGDLIYCGRNDSQIKIQGFRVELSEIEYTASRFLGKEGNALVLPLRSEGNCIELHLAVEGDEIDREGLESYLKKKLPVYMLPKRIHQISRFPVNTSNKIDRKKIMQLITH